MDFDNIHTTPGRAAEALGVAVFMAILVLRLWPFLTSLNITRISLKLRKWIVNPNRSPRRTCQQRAEPGEPTEGLESEFPDGWWNAQHRFDLERRAFFSKSWHYLLHESAIPNVKGAQLSLTFGGFNLTLLRGPETPKGIIRCFHNVCRHRAFKVFEKPSSIETLPTCRYHNWKYDTMGNFFWAKDFRHLEGFDTADKNLFQVKLENREGALWVKLEVDDWEEKAGLQSSPSDWSSTNSIPKLNGLNNAKVAESWEINAQFNWKVIARLNHQPQPALFNPESVSQTDRILSSLSWTHSSQAATLLSPLATLHPLTPTLFLTTNILPKNEGESVVRCELISTTRLRPTRRTIEAVRQDTERGIHPLNESFRLAMRDPDDSFMQLQTLDSAWKIDVGTQRAIHEQLSQHRSLERKKGRKLHPAGQQRPVGEVSDSYSMVDGICNDADGMFCAEKEDDRFGW